MKVLWIIGAAIAGVGAALFFALRRGAGDEATNEPARAIGAPLQSDTIRAIQTAGRTAAQDVAFAGVLGTHARSETESFDTRTVEEHGSTGTGGTATGTVRTSVPRNPFGGIV